MATRSLPCPECGHANTLPPAGTKKITCDGCGMIIVLAKVYGENWAAKAKAPASSAAPAAPARPKIVTRRGKDNKAAPEAPAAPAAGGARAGRAGRKSKAGAAPHPTGGHGHGHGHGHDHGHGHHHHHHHNSSKMSPALLWGSILGIVVVGVLAAVVLKNNADKEALRKEKEEAAVESSTTSSKRAEVPDIDAIAADLPEIESSSAKDETPTSVAEKKDTPPKTRTPKRSRSYELFPVDQIPAEIKSEIDGAITVLKDLDATTERRSAGSTLFSHRKEAIPVLINELFAIQLDDEKDVLRGWTLMQELINCSEHRTGFENDFNVMTWPTEASALEVAVRRRTTARTKWHDWWTDNGEGWEPPKEDESFFDD